MSVNQCIKSVQKKTHADSFEGHQTRNPTIEYICYAKLAVQYHFIYPTNREIHRSSIRFLEVYKMLIAYVGYRGWLFFTKVCQGPKVISLRAV